jgi:hypothetical protein
VLVQCLCHVAGAAGRSYGTPRSYQTFNVGELRKSVVSSSDSEVYITTTISGSPDLHLIIQMTCSPLPALELLDFTGDYG